MRKDYKDIYERTRLMLTKPEKTWPQVLEEDPEEKHLFRRYLLPIAGLTAGLVFLLSLIDHTLWQAVRLGCIRLIAIMLGTKIAYIIIRAYLCRKLSFRDNQALNLTVYSAAIFCLFQGVGTAFGDGFLGQLLIVFSLIFIRTFYTGLNRLNGIKPGQKNNILVIGTLVIIFMPITIAQLLMIIFRIPAINI